MTTLIAYGPYVLVISGVIIFCLSAGCGAWWEQATSDTEGRFAVAAVVSMWSFWIGLLGFILWAYDWWVMDIILGFSLLIGLTIIGLPWLFGQIAAEREERRQRALSPFTAKLKYGQRKGSQ